MNIARGLGNLSLRPRGGILAPATGATARYTPAGPFWQNFARTTPATADAQEVHAWDDMSGNGHHLLLADVNTGKFPLYKTAQINGLAVVRTDGVDDYLKAAAFVLNQPWTIFCALKPLRTSNFQTFWDGNTDITGWAGDLSFGAYNASLEYNGFFSSRAGNYVNGQCYWPGSRWTPGGLAPIPMLFSACYNGAASWVRINSAVKYTVNPGALNAAGFTLACRGDNATFPAKADYAEIIIYNRALTADEDAATLAYLNGKYNLFNASVPPGAPLVVCHGNSLTWGSFASIEGPYPGATSWPALLYRNYGSPVRAINLGTPGQTSTYLLGQYPYQVAPYYDAGASKKVAVFWEGVNEFAHVSTNAAAAYAKLNSWVAAAKATGYKAIVATALRSTNGVLTTAYWNPAAPTVGFQPDYNTLVLANTAGADAVVDLAAISQLADPTNVLYFAADRLHLVDAGYALIEAAFRPAIQAV